MSKEVRIKISYWFFLIAGIIGVSLQMYKYFIDDLDVTFGNGIVAGIFCMFILRPNILIEAFKMIINKFSNGTNAS